MFRLLLVPIRTAPQICVDSPRASRAEACDAELPDRDEGFDAEGSLAKDVIMKWRQNMLQQQRASGSETGGLPLRLKNDFDVRFKPRDSCKTLKMRELRACYVGALVQLDCMVVRTSQAKFLMR